MWIAKYTWQRWRGEKKTSWASNSSVKYSALGCNDLNTMKKEEKSLRYNNHTKKIKKNYLENYYLKNKGEKTKGSDQTSA